MSVLIVTNLILIFFFFLLFRFNLPSLTSHGLVYIVFLSYMSNSDFVFVFQLCFASVVSRPGLGSRGPVRAHRGPWAARSSHYLSLYYNSSPVGAQVSREFITSDINLRKRKFSISVMGQVTKVGLSCYLVLLSFDSKTRWQDRCTFVTWPICDIFLWIIKITVHRCMNCCRDHFVYAPSQEKTLQCNVTFHWLGTFTKFYLLISMISQHCFRKWLGALRQQAITQPVPWAGSRIFVKPAVGLVEILCN